MEQHLKVFADAGPAASPLYRQSRSAEDWRRARAAYTSLVVMGMPRANLLLIGIDGMVWNVLKTLLPELREPITSWRPGERLVLPPLVRGGTIILHDVGAMKAGDQSQLLEWLESAVGRTQVVSLTSMPLLPRVQAGAFLETLFYRLNTVCVDVTAP